MGACLPKSSRPIRNSPYFYRLFPFHFVDARSRLPFAAEPRNLENRKISGLLAKGVTMSAFEDHKDELEHYEKMLGAHRGRLAVTLDRVTNAMVLVGQHGVYCHSQRDASKPTMDIQMISEELRKAKELIQSVMEDLRVERENRLRAN
jgi:hypothetical protein